MPTKPFEPLLYRELRNVEAKETIKVASPLLQEEINYATNAFQRCQESSKGAPDEDLPVLTSYLHVIEMTDGIEALVYQCCSIPAIPLIRSAFEALLSIDYILEKDYRRRAFAWLVCYVHERLGQYELFDPSNPKSKEFSINLASDELNKYVKLPSFPNIPSAIKNLQSLLNNPNYRVAELEYQNLKSKRKRKPRWYSLFGGPSNLRDLAIQLNRGAQYELLYRYWSSITHADDISRFLTKTKKGQPVFKPLRNPENLGLISVIASSLILHATQHVMGKFRPGESRSLGSWYIREVRNLHLALTK